MAHWSVRSALALPPLAIALIGLTLPSLAPTPAEARNNGRNAAAAAAAARQRMIAATQAQLQQARQILAGAQAEMAQAGAKIEASNSRVKEAKSALDTAKSDERSNHEALDQLEASLLAKAGSDSEIGKAHAELLAAQEELDLAKSHVLQAADYRDKVAEITDPDDRPKKLPLIRREAFKNNERYQAALSHLKAAKLKYGGLRTEMVRNSPEWMAASQAVKDSQTEENKANAEATKGAMAKMPAASNFRDARAIAEEAQATIMQCEYVLQRLGVKPPPPPKNPNYGK